MITIVEKEIPGSMEIPSRDGIMRFVRPRSGGNKATYAFNDFFKQYYFFNGACPRYMVMLEEYGTDDSFISYVFEARGMDLTAISCTEHTSNGTTAFSAGYPYLRLPADKERHTEWEYSISREISVRCRAEFRKTVTGCEILKVTRQMMYTDSRVKDINAMCEYYLPGSGIVRIECSKPL